MTQPFYTLFGFSILQRKTYWRETYLPEKYLHKSILKLDII